MVRDELRLTAPGGEADALGAIALRLYGPARRHLPPGGLLMLRFGHASLYALVLSKALPAVAAEPAPAAPDVGVFARYAGTWKVDLHHVETPYSKASNESMTVKNDCWRSEIFYVCDQIIDGSPKALIVFFYNAEDKRYGSFPITARSDTVHPGDVLVDGKTITFPWAINDNGKTVHMRIVNTFTSADSMDFRHEYSEDGKTWVAMATGVEHKVGKAK
jgi:hypothetical protein